MTEITITVDREELINDLHHLGNSINSLGALGFDAETFNRHARELSEDYVAVLRANTPLQIADDSPIFDDPEDVLGYVAADKATGDLFYSTFSRTHDHTHARLNLNVLGSTRENYEIIPVRKANL